LKPRLRLLCDSNPMAYGSTSAMLAALDHTDAHHTAMAGSITQELLAHDPVIHERAQVDNKDVAQVRAVLDQHTFDAALVVSNRSNLDLYRSRGLPVFFLDILFWYGDEKSHSVWDTAEEAFVQDFPGVRERIESMRMARPPTVVGAVIRRPPPSAPSGRTLLNLGGVRSRFIDDLASRTFLSIVRSTIDGVDHALPDGEVDVACGTDAAAWLRQRLPARYLPRTLRAAEMARVMASASLVLTTPGLNAVLEGIVARRPMAFVPPQNASQVFQLARYESAGIVREGLNLPALLGREFPAQLGDERAYSNRVLEALAAIESCPSRTSSVVEHVLEQIAEQRSPRLRAAQERFAEQYCGDGASAIGAAIRRWWQR
jgi:hypothetical protein